MKTVDLKVITDGDSPRGWRQYMLLHSPKAGLLSRSNLPFVILFFGVGVFLGGTLNILGSRMVPGCATQLKSKHITSVRTNIRETSNTFIRGQSVDNSLPIAWLMSFPNSGTSYTSYLVRVVSGKMTATNYGSENLGQDGTSVTVFNEHPEGPFWADPINRKYVWPKRGRDRGYLLTKTHCGGRCDKCPPERYIENHHIFLRRCFEGYRITRDIFGESEKVLGSYDKDLVKKAVHLIRDPFDNIVSRFHLTYKHFIKKNHTDQLALYPRSREGFRAFCKDLGERYVKEEKASEFYHYVFDDVKDIPCHADFFRYIQWHNLAFTTTWDLHMPTMILHYENYTDNFNKTKDTLMM